MLVAGSSATARLMRLSGLAKNALENFATGVDNLGGALPVEELAHPSQLGPGVCSPAFKPPGFAGGWLVSWMRGSQPH
jgi:hypothetical protein